MEDSIFGSPEMMGSFLFRARHIEINFRSPRKESNLKKHTFHLMILAVGMLDSRFFRIKNIFILA